MKKIGIEKLVTIILSVLVVLMVALVVLQNTVGLGALFGGSSNAGPAGGAGGRRAGASGASAVINVEARAAQRSTFVKTISVNGELSYRDSARSVIADTTGKITEILVKRGEYVRVGQVVAKADPSTPGAEYKIKDIVATVSGTVQKVDAYVGLSVSANTAVITISNPSELVLKLNVPEKYLSSLHLGSEVYFSTAAWPEERYSGIVSYIGSEVSTGTRTVETEVEVETPDSRLMAGMFVRALLVVDKQEDVFTVPTEALSTYLNNRTLYVVRSGRAVRVNVLTGSYNDSVTVVKEGLSDGDLVIVAGTVTDGTAVNIIIGSGSAEDSDSGSEGAGVEALPDSRSDSRRSEAGSVRGTDDSALSGQSGQRGNPAGSAGEEAAR